MDPASEFALGAVMQPIPLNVYLLSSNTLLWSPLVLVLKTGYDNILGELLSQNMSRNVSTPQTPKRQNLHGECASAC